MRNTKTTTVTDSSNHGQTFVNRTITIEKSVDEKPEYYSKTVDLVSIIAWPLAIIIIILILKKQIELLLKAISSKITDSNTFTITKGGITVASGTKTDSLNETKVEISQDNVLPGISTIDAPSKKILSTLWIHQNEYDRHFKTRWTFTLGTSAPDYLSFSQSAHRLHWVGLITYDQSNGQYFLTDLGIKFCHTNQNEIGDFSYFKN
jgi:hypothetical protein